MGTEGTAVERDVEWVATQVVDAAYKVYRALGPGLLEAAYEAALYHELVKRGLAVRRQVAVPVEYDGVALGTGFRIDLLVEDQVIVELKAVNVMHAVFEAQILTHLRLSKKRVGFLINFHAALFKQGCRRFAV